jgi:hypothetical protein
MKIKELIAELQKLDGELIVLNRYDNDYNEMTESDICISDGIIVKNNCFYGNYPPLISDQIISNRDQYLKHPELFSKEIREIEKYDKRLLEYEDLKLKEFKVVII